MKENWYTAISQSAGSPSHACALQFQHSGNDKQTGGALKVNASSDKWEMS